MSFRVEEIEKNIRNLNTKLCCIQKQIEQGATLEGENAIVYVGAEGVLQTSVDNLRYSETGLFIKGIDTQNVLTINNHLDASLLTLTNSGILTFGVNELNLLTDLSVQNDLLYFDTINDRIGIGTSTPEATLSIRSQGTSNRRGILVEHSDNVTAFSQSKFIGARSRGSHGSPTAVLNNDSLVSFNAVGYKATGWSDTLGGMYVYAGDNFTDVSTPTYITFRGVASGTIVSEWLRLSPILTHTFTNTDYSGIDTGYSLQFKRTANTGLRLGTLATLTATYNSSSNLSIIQAQHNNAASVLQINPYGGDTHIGSRNNKVVIGNPTLNSDSTQSVIICGGDSGYGAPALIVGLRGDGINGIRFWGYGNDGQYFNSMIRGYADNILFRQQLIQIGNANPTAYLTTASTNSRLEINVAHRTMVDSSTLNQGNTYYQRFSWIKGSAAADMYSYMMIGSHALSTMGMQMKISSDAVTFSNGNITLNPFGGNVGVGIATAPTASLHVKGNSDSVGSVLKLESLSNNILEVYNTRDVLFGGGSLSANTQVEINAYRAAGTSNFVFRVNALGGQNYMSFINSVGNTSGGLYISRDSAGIGRQAFSVGGGGGTSFVLTSNGSIGINTSTAGAISTNEIYNNGLINSNVSGKNGLYFVTAGSQRGFIFQHLGSGSFNSSQAVFQITKDFTNAEVGILVDRLFEINGTYNFTNGTKGLIGINYNTTITALSGSHYGILIRPDSLNGFGLGATLPTALVDLEGSTIARASLRIRSGSAPTSPNDGDIWNSGTDLFVRLGGTTYTLVKV